MKKTKTPTQSQKKSPNQSHKGPVRHICPFCGNSKVQLQRTHWILRTTTITTHCRNAMSGLLEGIQELCKGMNLLANNEHKGGCDHSAPYAKQVRREEKFLVIDLGWILQNGEVAPIERQEIRSFRQPEIEDIRCQECKDHTHTTTEVREVEMYSADRNSELVCVICGHKRAELSGGEIMPIMTTFNM